MSAGPATDRGPRLAALDGGRIDRPIRADDTPLDQGAAEATALAEPSAESGARRRTASVVRALPPDAGLSEVLRWYRRRGGHGLRDVATALRIRLAHLQAIEDGRFDELPGTVYAVGFVRSYAEFLELDPDEMVARFKQEISGQAASADLRFPQPVRRSGPPGALMIVIALLLGGIAYGSWYGFSVREYDLSGLTSTVPDRIARLFATEATEGSVADDWRSTAIATPSEPFSSTGVPPTSGSAASTEGPPATEPASAEPASAEPVSDVASSGPASVGRTAAGDTTRPADDLPSSPEIEPTVASLDGASVPPAAVGAPPRPAGVEPIEAPIAAPGDDLLGDLVAPPPDDSVTDGAIGGGSEGEHRVLLVATADSWVQVKGAGGALIMTRVLAPGETYAVPELKGLTLVTGNAGGLRITIDGETMPSLGEPGDVLRDVPLDADALRAALLGE